MKTTKKRMKKSGWGMALACALLCGNPIQGEVLANTAVSPSSSGEEYVYHGAGNPYLPLWEHLPDGEPRVFEDPDRPGHYRIYIIGSHDLRYDSYCGPDIRMWSAPVDDLSSWRDEGPIFTYAVDGEWDVMYAPDLVEIRRKDGRKEYYLYPHSRGAGREAMIARGDRPDGPFTPVNLTPDGKRTLPGSILGFDPSIYVEYVSDPSDPDYEIGFRAYGYWGFQRSMAAQLDQSTMYSVRPGTEVIPYFMPAGLRYGELRQPDVPYPCIWPGEDLGAFNFFEASSIRRIGNKYVTIYSGYSGPDYGVGSSNSALRYAYSDSPLGPWKSGGVLVDSRAPELNSDGTRIVTTNAGHNTHGSMEQINGQWYVFYHRPPRGFGFARQAMVAPVKVVSDERPVSEGGKVVITGYDPFAPEGRRTVADSQGHEYRGAEVTSEGFHIYGLPPYAYYSAGIACYLSDVRLQQDSWDVWDNGAPVGGMRNGHIVGYKYFGFGGLDAPRNGLKAFEGTAKGNATRFNLFLKPLTDEAFKVSVWLDGPWDNAVWKGIRLGEISVPAGSVQEVTRFSLDVSAAVDGLDGKHAVYLVAEGTGQAPLCDLIGLGFSKKGQTLERPQVPVVQIKADGKDLAMPVIPLRSTSANGLTDCTTYEVRCDVPSSASSMPRLSAVSSDPSVAVSVTQDSKDKDGMVKCTYRGQTKTYLVRFKRL